MLPSHAKLAKTLNISVPSLREGLQTLATLGVLRIAHGKGTIVHTPNLSDLRRLFPPIIRSAPHSRQEVLEMLRILVPEALAGIDPGSTAMADMETCARAMASTEPPGAPANPRAVILRFYSLLGGGGGNRLFAQILEAVASLRFASSIAVPGREEREAQARIHLTALEALRRGRREEAAQVLLDFLSSICEGNRSISVVFDTFGSGSIGGSFYGLARDLCRILLQQGGIAIEPEPTGGGIQNVTLAEEGRIILGLTQSDVARAAYEGHGLFPRRHLGIRAICGVQTLMLWILVRGDSGRRSVGDLRGARIALGAMGGDSGIVAEAVLRAYGLREGDYRPLFLSLSNAVHGLRGGEVDALFFLASTPQTAISELAADLPVEVLPVEAARGADVVASHDSWLLAEIPPGALTGQDRAVTTLAVPSILITHADVGADIVKRITQVIMEQGPEGEGAPETLPITLATALQGVSIPLHPGAEEYYGERGIVVPDPIRSAAAASGGGKEG